MVLKKAVLEGFNYVVYKAEPAKICFGSTQERNTCPIGKNLSGFQMLFTMEPNRLSPFSYETERYKTVSQRDNIPAPVLTLETGEKIKFRTGARSPRFRDNTIRTPSPTRYEVGLKWEEPKQAKHPFNVGSQSDRACYTVTPVPGPGAYNFERWKCRKTLVQYNFGKPTKEDIIEMICIPRPRSECTKCKNLCVGDYWHQDYTVFLCMSCWWEERRTSEIYKKKELAKFKKIRNCSFMHSHEGTTATINLLSASKLRKKMNLESTEKFSIQEDEPSLRIVSPRKVKIPVLNLTYRIRIEGEHRQPPAPKSYFPNLKVFER